LYQKKRFNLNPGSVEDRITTQQHSFFLMTNRIHQTILQKPWNGFKHIARIYYNYSDSYYPDINRIDMHRIEEDETISECVSSVTVDGYGEDRLTLDDRLTGIMILIDDEVIDCEL